MRQIRLWTDEEIVKKEVKSCDNRDLGDVKQVDSSLIVSEKGGKRFQIPRESIATFDGDHLWLRATEAEVATGIYPFLSEEKEQEFERERRLDNTTVIPPPPSNPPSP
jgi:hypothetical protein